MKSNLDKWFFFVGTKFNYYFSNNKNVLLSSVKLKLAQLTLILLSNKRTSCS